MINYSGDFAGIRSRKITEDTCKKFNVRVDAGPVIRFPYYAGGRVVACKERDQSKNFTWQGKNEEDQLFGQQNFGSGKTVVITEGEMDALSVWQARPNWPVVSVPNGAKAAKKALSKQLTYLLGFNEIVLMFDNDDAGKEGSPCWFCDGSDDEEQRRAAPRRLVEHRPQPALGGTHHHRPSLFADGVAGF